MPPGTVYALLDKVQRTCNAERGDPLGPGGFTCFEPFQKAPPSNGTLTTDLSANKTHT